VSDHGYFLLSAETTFSAAHTLPGAGACEQMHGHNWRVRISVRVDETQLDGQGMGIDFRIMDEIVESSVSDFDHAYLNNIEPFRKRPPTAELIAREVYQRCDALLKKALQSATLSEVEVWEMAGYRAVYRPR
jgi:6-pyruvoyltetrahydropterin/6-carboxytetrahydropterin synthase